MGVLVYFLVTADYPVRMTGLTWAEMVKAFPQRRPLIDLRPDLPESLLRTVSAALEIEPARRFKSAGELANALGESLGTQAPVELSVARDQQPRTRKSRIWLFVVPALAVTVMTGYLAWPGNLQRLLHRTTIFGTTTPSQNDEFLKAQDLLLHSYREANLAEAITRLKAVLQKDPNNGLAEACLGAAYFAQHAYTQDPKLLEMAKDAINRAVTLDPELAAPYIALARIAAMEGQTQLATQQVQKALALEPRSPDAHGALGEVYEAQGRRKDAILEYQKAG
jgi:tetratricopeptide (TPR) repeat protein